MRLPLLWLAASVLLAACAGFGDREHEVTTETPTWVTDIAPLMEARCNTCHGEDPPRGVPDYFRTDLIDDDGDTNGVRTMSTTHLIRLRDVADPMPPVPSGPLSNAEVALFDRWVALGMPLDETELVDVGGDAGTEDAP